MKRKINCFTCGSDKIEFSTKSEIKGNIKKKWTEKRCFACKNTETFGFCEIPYYPENEPSAHYKNEKGRRLLKVGGIFKEVCIAINKKNEWRVMPLDEVVDILVVKKDWKLLYK